MRKVYKYHLEVVSNQRIQLPRYSAILCVQTQRDEPFLWALVDSSLSAPTEEWLITTVATGDRADGQTAANYIGTYQLNDGNLVFHVFAVNTWKQ